MQHLPASDKIDMEYLKSEEIGRVLAKGMAELYKTQPTFPVNYLANWLLNYSKSQVNRETLHQVLRNKEVLIAKQEHQTVIAAQQHEEELEKEHQRQLQDDKFRHEIEHHQFHEKLLCAQFCDYLVKDGLTGVYVGYVDFPPKPLTEQDDDESAHQFTDQPKIIKYVGTNQSHRFLIGQTLSLEAGVTGRVFDAPPVQDPPADGEEVPPPPSMAVYVPSVVHEPKMVYFKWPKLGAFFAVPLVYQSCLLPKALDAGVENRLVYKKALADQIKEREAKETEYQEKIRIAQEAGEEIDAIVDELNAIKAEWSDVKEAEFVTEQRQFVVCFDTLGQDRQITVSARKHYEEYTYFFAEMWEQRERQLLSADIDAMINYYEQVSTKERSDQLTLLEDQAIDQNQSKFDDLKDREKEYQFEIQSVRLQALTQQITDPSLYNELIQLKEMRVLKFPGILQALLIFLGYTKEEINVPGTNILDWTRIKPLVSEGLFEKIGAYTHRGPKTDQIQPYAKLSRVGKRLEKLDQEQVDSYNVCYGKLLKWLQLTIQLRRTDIEIRRIKIAEKKQLRETRQAEVERIKEAKTNALADHKNGLSAEDQETFVQEDWENNYDVEHPLPEIPDDVENDIDEDYDEV